MSTNWDNAHAAQPRSLHVLTLVHIGRQLGLDYALAVYQALKEEPRNDHGDPEDWRTIAAQIRQHPPVH